MSRSNDIIDDQIRNEIERIKRELVDWELSSAPDHRVKRRWKPRFDTEHFIRDGNKRLIPTVIQAYYDLQQSRSVLREKGPNPEWEFASPEEGVSAKAALNTERLDHFVSFFPVTNKTRMLELGMRSGHFLYYLLSIGYRHVCGIDCVRLNVLWCQKNGLEVSEVDAHELSKHFAPGSHDVIFAYHVLEHCYDPVKVLAECRTVLSPLGGLHIEIPIGDINPGEAHCYGFQLGELRKMLKSHRYDVLDYVYRNGIERVVARKQSARSGSLLAKFLVLLQKRHDT